MDYQNPPSVDWLTRLANLENQALASNPNGDQFILGGRVGFKKLTTPSAPTVVVTGGAAGTQVYGIVALFGSGKTPLGATASTSGAGPTTLSTTTFNTLTWSPTLGATGYLVYRTSGGPSQGLIATVAPVYGATSYSLVDTGLAGDSSVASPIGNSSAIGGAEQAPVNVYATTSAAITECGLAIIAGSGVIALTLAAPIAGLFSVGGMDGMTLVVLASQAAAHTVTTPASTLNGASHIATFASAVGNNIVLRAYNGVWYVQSQVGITLS